MRDATALALVLCIAGFAVVVYFTTELAGMFFGDEPLPPSLRQMARTFGTHGPRSGRLFEGVTRVIMLFASEGLIIFALLFRRDDFDFAGQLLLLAELVASTIWGTWLVLRYRRSPG